MKLEKGFLYPGMLICYPLFPFFFSIIGMSDFHFQKCGILHLWYQRLLLIQRILNSSKNQKGENSDWTPSLTLINYVLFVHWKSRFCLWKRRYLWGTAGYKAVKKAENISIILACYIVWLKSILPRILWT